MKKGVVNALRHASTFGKKYNTKGEEKVSNCLLEGLDAHDYYMIDGATIQDGDEIHEYAHIIIGDNGAFIIQTEDFGDDYRNTGIRPTEVYVDRQNSWKAKYTDNEIELENPTDMVLKKKKAIEHAVDDMFLDIHPLVVLPEDQVNLHDDDSLPYKVISTRNLCSYIKHFPDRLSVSDRTEFVSRMGDLITE